MAKLMLVEDDNNLREIYEARLQAEGYQIIAAKDGEEALVLAKQEKPDLIIADVMMPKISGFEMLDIMRNTAELKDVKVIMLTALGQSDDQQRATKLGADRYLVKSQVTLEDIVKVSHELLGDQAATARPDTPKTPAATPAPTPATATAAPEPEPAPAPAAASPPAAPAPTPAPAPEPAAVLTQPTAPAAAASPPTTVAAADDEPAAAAAEPTAAPAPEPAPTPSPASVSAPEPADQAVADGAQSVSQEEADVESRVEDFVAGATEEAPPSAPAPTVDNTPADGSVQPTPSTTVEPTDPSAAAADDKLMADAAEALVNSTEATPDAAAGATIEPVANAISSTEAPTAAEDTPKPPADGRGKKVIKPLNSGPKTDINTLLALEEAKEAKAKGPPPPVPVIAADNPKAPHGSIPPNPVITPPAIPEDVPSGAPASTAPEIAPNNPADPNSIAL